MKWLIAFIVTLILTSASTYFYLHVILKEDIFSEWYEYVCYGVCVIVSIMIAKEAEK